MNLEFPFPSSLHDPNSTIRLFSPRSIHAPFPGGNRDRDQALMFWSTMSVSIIRLTRIEPAYPE